MYVKATALAVFFMLPLAAGAQQRSYTWVDDEGVRHYGDKIPAEYADKDKGVVNEHGVVVREIEGKKTEEELEAERIAAELELQRELQKRADRALLATYQNVGEIEMHRDRRVELFQAQSRVTELYLRNLDRRLQQLKKESQRYRPYSSDPGRTDGRAETGSGNRRNRIDDCASPGQSSEVQTGRRRYYPAIQR